MQQMRKMKYKTYTQKSTIEQYEKMSIIDLKNSIDFITNELSIMLKIWQERLNNGKSRQDYKRGKNV